MQDKIRQDMKEAMKARDAARTAALRMLVAAIKNEQVAKQKDLEDADVIAVIQREIKSTREALEQFRAAGRDDLVDKTEAELAVYEQYIPEQVSGADLEKIVDEAIAAVGAASKADMGKVMKEVMATHRGQVDGKAVQQLVMQKLS